MPRGRQSKLTPELIDAICERIRVGTYPYVAAAACGVPRSTYYGWMEKAKKKGTPRIYKELSDKISEAAAAARSNAEVRVFRDRPFEWLRYGPGRERPEQPGWTETPQQVQIEAQTEHKLPASYPDAETQAEGLLYLEQLGIITIHGLHAPEEEQKRLEVESEPPDGSSPSDDKGDSKH